MIAIRHADDEILNLGNRIESLYEQLTGDEEKDEPINEELDRLQLDQWRLLFAKGEVYLSQSKLITVKTGETAGDAADFLDAALRTFKRLTSDAGDDTTHGRPLQPGGLNMSFSS